MCTPTVTLTASPTLCHSHHHCLQLQLEDIYNYAMNVYNFVHIYTYVFTRSCHCYPSSAQMHACMYVYLCVFNCECCAHPWDTKVSCLSFLDRHCVARNSAGALSDARSVSLDCLRIMAVSCRLLCLVVASGLSWADIYELVSWYDNHINVYLWYLKWCMWNKRFGEIRCLFCTFKLRVKTLLYLAIFKSYIVHNILHFVHTSFARNISF